MATPSRKPVSFEELRARDDVDRLEIVGGEVVHKAVPSTGHSFAEIKLGVAIDPYNRRPGPKGPGGWWLYTELHVGYPGGDVYCHDAAGYRRDRLAERPSGWPVRERLDWVCEIVSPGHERHDLVDKPRVLHAAEVGHYWLVVPEEKVLLVHRWSRDGYVVVLRAAAGEVVRAEPFDGIDLHVGELFGDEE